MTASFHSGAPASSSAGGRSDDAPPKGAVLAGGLARRMGGAKAGVELGGRPLIAYPLAALHDAGLETAVVAKEHTPLPHLTVPILIERDDPDRPLFHPLCGILFALRNAAGSPVVVIGCDMPFVTAPLVRHLAGLGAPLAVPSVDGRLEPLAARYDASVVPALEVALAAREPVRDAIAQLDPVIVDERQLRRFGDPKRLFMNVNTPAELARAERLLSGSA